MKIKFLLSLLVALSLSACGGGGSNSGGGGIVIFTGTQTLILTAAGISSQDTVAFSMEVNGSTVTIRDEDFVASAQLVGNSFSVSSPQLTIEVDASTTCTGSVIYDGMIAGAVASGTLNGDFNCGSLGLVLTGTFSANSGNAKAVVKTFSDAIRDAVR